MRSKSVALAVAVSLVVFLSASVFAGDVQVSQQTLAKMGLAGMDRVSDGQGMEIRGTGSSALVFGIVSASGGPTKTYFKVNPHFAAGGKVSFGSGSFAAGGSVAFAK